MTQAIVDLERSTRELLLLLESAVHNGEALEVALEKAYEAGKRVGTLEGFDRAANIIREQP